MPATTLRVVHKGRSELAVELETNKQLGINTYKEVLSKNSNEYNQRLLTLLKFAVRKVINTPSVQKRLTTTADEYAGMVAVVLKGQIRDDMLKVLAGEGDIKTFKGSEIGFFKVFEDNTWDVLGKTSVNIPIADSGSAGVLSEALLYGTGDFGTGSIESTLPDLVPLISKYITQAGGDEHMFHIEAKSLSASIGSPNPKTDDFKRLVGGITLYYVKDIEPEIRKKVEELVAILKIVEKMISVVILQVMQDEGVQTTAAGKKYIMFYYTSLTLYAELLVEKLIKAYRENSVRDIISIDRDAGEYKRNLPQNMRVGDPLELFNGEVILSKVKLTISLQQGVTSKFDATKNPKGLYKSVTDIFSASNQMDFFKGLIAIQNAMTLRDGITYIARNTQARKAALDMRSGNNTYSI